MRTANILLLLFLLHALKGGKHAEMNCAMRTMDVSALLSCVITLPHYSTAWKWHCVTLTLILKKTPCINHQSHWRLFNIL